MQPGDRVSVVEEEYEEIHTTIVTDVILPAENDYNHHKKLGALFSHPPSRSVSPDTRFKRTGAGANELEHEQVEFDNTQPARRASLTDVQHSGDT